jgi:heat shock protein HslJ
MIISPWVLAMALLFWGCQKEETLAPPDPDILALANAPSAELEAIQDVVWTLAKLPTGSGFAQLQERDRPWFLLQSRTQVLDGHTGCNQVNATYELSERKFLLSDVVRTRIHCPGTDALERAFLNALGADRYRLQNDSLVLLHGNRELGWFVR